MVRQNIPVPIDCLDKARTLLFTFNSAAEIKRAVGSNPMGWSPIEWSIRLIDPEFLPMILAAMLAHESAAPPAEMVRSLITTGDQMESLTRAVMRAVAHFQGKSDEEFDKELEEFLEKVKKLNEALSGTDPLMSPVVN